MPDLPKMRAMPEYLAELIKATGFGDFQGCKPGIGMKNAAVQ
jgi:hypothetical protein